MTKVAVPKQKVGIDLTEGNILKQLIRVAVPLLLANLLQQLYNAVDMMVIGHYVGSTGTVGVSAGGEIATMATFLATSFGSAAQIYVSQLAGARKYQSISEVIGTSMAFMMLMSLVCAAGSILFSRQFLTWLNCPQEAFSQAQSYMIVVSTGLPFVFGYNAICGVLRGMGEAKRPLMFVAIAAAANVVMDILFVVIIPLEAAGTAIATVAAQLASFGAASVFLYKRKQAFQLDLSLKGMKIHKKHFAVLMELGIPLSLQSAMIHGTQIICSSYINSFGLVASATNSIGNKVHKLINVFTISMRAGAGTMVGQNLGARKIDRVHKVVFAALGLSFCFAAGASVVSLHFPRQAFALFTQDPEVIEFGVVYLRIFFYAVVLSAFQGGFGAVVTGSGHARLSFIGGLLDGVIIRLGLSFLLAYGFEMGVVGFFYGSAFARVAPLLISAGYYFSGRWKTRKLLVDAQTEDRVPS